MLRGAFVSLDGNESGDDSMPKKPSFLPIARENSAPRIISDLISSPIRRPKQKISKGPSKSKGLWDAGGTLVFGSKDDHTATPRSPFTRTKKKPSGLWESGGSLIFGPKQDQSSVASAPISPNSQATSPNRVPVSPGGHSTASTSAMSVGGTTTKNSKKKRADSIKIKVLDAFSGHSTIRRHSDGASLSSRSGSTGTQLNTHTDSSGKKVVKVKIKKMPSAPMTPTRTPLLDEETEPYQDDSVRTPKVSMTPRASNRRTPSGRKLTGSNEHRGGDQVGLPTRPPVASSPTKQSRPSAHTKKRGSSSRQLGNKQRSDFAEWSESGDTYGDMTERTTTNVVDEFSALASQSKAQFRPYEDSSRSPPSAHERPTLSMPSSGTSGRRTPLGDDSGMELPGSAKPSPDVTNHSRTSFSLTNTSLDSYGSSDVKTTTLLYEYARTCQWELVSDECHEHPRDAKCVGSKHGTTALHLAVLSRTNPSLRDGEMGDYRPAPISLIEELVSACPEAAITRCSAKKYTPLVYASLVSDANYDMEDCAAMARILLKYAPESAYVFTDEGFSALDVHILSYSRIHKHRQEIDGSGESSVLVIRELLSEKPFLADARAYKNKVRGPLELLYRSNLDDFKQADVSMLDQWWAWKWILLILEFTGFSSDDDKKKRYRKKKVTFSALHAAARTVGVPLPVLRLAAKAFPEQLEIPNPCHYVGNMPLHEVCLWICDTEVVCGDPFIIRRKSQAIQCMLEEYPRAARMTNCMGETPLQLAVETCTLWDGGLKMLVEACPEALAVPRMLREIDGENNFLLSVPTGDDAESEDSEDEDEVDPMEAVEGMYPFLVAGVFSRVPESKRKIPAFMLVDQTPAQHKRNLKTKDLESLRSIYGLLRANPEVLDVFISGDEYVDEDVDNAEESAEDD